MLQIAFFLVVPVVVAQKGLASVNDPCDCMQHHDFWIAARPHLTDIIYKEHFASRIFDTGVFETVSQQGCMYKPETEEAHRPTAVSDCIPGFLLMHILCMQQHVVQRDPGQVLEYAAELARLLPWGAHCLKASGWQLDPVQVEGYVRRVRRVYAKGAALMAAGSPEAEAFDDSLLKQMAWPFPRHSVDFLVYDDGDVCPASTVPDNGLCWVLGSRGASCSQSCQAEGLVFSDSPSSVPTEAFVDRLLVLSGGTSHALRKDHSWAPFECYVPDENRFHIANFLLPSDADWAYSICRLACPCRPSLPPSFRDVLKLVPEFRAT